MENNAGARPVGDVEYLLDAVGQDWVQQRVDEFRVFEQEAQRSGGRKRGLRSFHPLAEAASQYMDASDFGAAHRSMGDRLIRLALLGQALRTLEGVNGLEARVANLRSGDDTLHYATEFEIISAALYVQCGHTIEFVEETNKPSFDLLVDCEIEVECKHATLFTPSQKSAAAIWRLLDRRLRALFDEHEDVFFLYLSVPNQPTRSQVDEILNEFRSLAKNKVVRASKTHGEVQYRYHRASPKEVKGGIKGPIPSWFPNQADHFRFEINAERSGSTLEHGRGCGLAFDSRTPSPEPTKVIEKQLRKTPRQFTGTRPAVVHADITNALRRSRLQLNEAGLEQSIRSWLNRHPEVAAVNLLAPTPGPVTALLEFHIERNPNPTYELPRPFLGMG